MTYRRPSIRALALAAIVATSASLLVAFSRPVQIVVDGRPVPSDVPPVSTMSDVYVPLRTFGDALGAEIDVTKNGIDLIRGDRSLHVRVGDVHATIDGEPFTLQRAPFRVRGRVMVGLHAIARAFGVHAAYDARTAQIQVMTPGVGVASPVQTPVAQ